VDAYAVPYHTPTQPTNSTNSKAMATPRWGDDVDDSDDEVVPAIAVTPIITMGSNNNNINKKISIPPTQKSRIDSNGIQIVTSYRLNPSNKGQLLKTITKVKVTTERIKEPLAVAERRKWKPFGQAVLDDKGVTQSKEEILLEDPNADTDLQEEDPNALGNLNAFWAKQQKRQLQRKYDVEDDPDAGPTSGGGRGDNEDDDNANNNNSNDDAADRWTQVGSTSSSVAKYVPPSMRGGGAASASGGSSAYKPERRMDDLNTIRVTNLSETTSEADLQYLFSQYGRISRVYLAKDKETMQSRGFAFVSFVNKDDAAIAMKELQGYGYDHLILKLEWARPNTPKDPASSGTEFRSGYGKALAQDTKERVSYASNLTK
jgi:translation initiation factor 3 subunit G